jgi:hypothetical protein
MWLNIPVVLFELKLHAQEVLDLNVSPVTSYADFFLGFAQSSRNIYRLCYFSLIADFNSCFKTSLIQPNFNLKVQNIYCINVTITV